MHKWVFTLKKILKMEKCEHNWTFLIIYSTAPVNLLKSFFLNLTKLEVKVFNFASLNLMAVLLST